MTSGLRNILLVALCLAVWPVAAFCQTVKQSTPEWLATMGGSGSSVNATGVKIDAAGNIYVTGTFKGTVDFDPSTTGTSNLSAGANTSGFIAKYKSDGSFIWAYPLAGASVFPSGLSVSNGAINIIGKFSGSFDANPGPLVNTLTGTNDAFIIHLKDDGSFLWAKSVGGTGTDIGNEVASDDAGNVYTALQFQSTINVGGTSYTAIGTTDGMLIKYDATGNIIFAIDLGYAGADNTVSGVVVDKAGNIDIIGYLNGPVNFNPLGISFLSSDVHSMYLAQYTPDGKLKWVNNIEQGFSNDNNINIALTATNDIYITGNYSGAIQFGPGTLHAKGTRDLFFARYLQNGQLDIYKSVGGTGASVAPADIAISDDGKSFYISGSFTGSVDFSTNANPAKLDYHSGQDWFLVKYNSVGDIIVGTNTGSACPNASANGLAIVNSTKVIVTGTFCSNVSFGGAACAPYNLSSIGSQDMFLGKYSEPLPIANNIIVNQANCTGGPNNFQGYKPTGGFDTYDYEWQRSTDGTHFTEIVGAYAKDYTPQVESDVVYYVRKVTSGPCVIASYSNIIAVDPSASAAITNNYIIKDNILNGCGGAGSTNLTASSPNGGGGNYAYQWQISFNNLDWTNIQAGPYTTPNSQNLAAVSYNVSFYLRRLVTIPGCGVPNISPVETFTATPRIDNITIHATGSIDFCGPGDPGTLKGDKEKPTGGDGNYTYQWRSTTTNDFQDIPGAIEAEYKPGVLTQTTFFKREVTSGPCYTGDPGNNSNPIIVTVKKKVTLNNNLTQPVDNVLCRADADPPKITGDVPGGGTAPVGVDWESSIDNAHWASVGYHGNEYDPPKITQTTYFRRVVTYDSNTECADVSFSTVVFKIATPVGDNKIQRSPLDPDLICSVPAKPHTITGEPLTGVTYQWQNSVDGGAHFNDIENATSVNYDPPESFGTIIYHRLIIVNDKCLAPLPSNDVAIAVSPVAALNRIKTPADSVFCDQGNAGVIDGPNIDGAVYQWQSSPDGKDDTYMDITTGDYNYSTYDPPAGNTTMYYRRVASTSICKSISNVVAIRVFPTPVPVVSAAVAYVCAGDNVAISASGGNQYKWTPADGLSDANVASPKASPKVTTLYNVEVSNDGHCGQNGLVNVIVVPKPTANAGADRRMFKGESIKLDGKVTGDNLHYSWSPATYLDDPNSLTPVVTAPQTMTYTLTVTSEHGCNIVTDDIKISVYERVVVPTGFTPNGDGVNDQWEILGLNTYPGSILTVYNRNGAEVFKTISYAKTWDGTYQGHTLPFGTYYYVIDLKDGTKPLSGWVSLIK